MFFCFFHLVHWFIRVIAAVYKYSFVFVVNGSVLKGVPN